MKGKAASSFSYRDIFRGDTVMIFVPHEDDEINLAGASICGAVQEGLRAICVFVTNGDWEYAGSVRLKEAIAALNEMRVPAEDVIFLGYPDGGMHAERSVFLQRKNHMTDAAGRKETCGMPGKPEFCMQKHGIHRRCTWENLLTDIREVVLEYRPDTVLVTDFDAHPDHRMCSIAFETAMGQILNRPDNEYCPLVLKGFAYSTAYEAPKDFYESHLLSCCMEKEHLRDPEDETDNPVYEWGRRIRFPVPKNCREPHQMENILYKALKQHLSQMGAGRAVRIINGDQVFWRRRTDNLAYRGRTSVSSGDGKYLHDFLMMNTDNISVPCPHMTDYLWTPAEEDTEKCCRCSFAQPCHIESVSLYGNIETDSRIVKGKLIFSTGFSYDTGPLQTRGRETEIDFPPQDDVKWIEFRILASEGKQAGLSEWEFFEEKNTSEHILKILADGNFAYAWKVYEQEPSPQISAYTCGSIGPLKWYADGQETSLEKINEACRDMKENMIVRVETETPKKLWDEVAFIRASCLEYWLDMAARKIDWGKSRIVHKQMKKKNRKIPRIRGK